jgi:NAD(P)-dependent dehydrogenase (short-subunit alcohol dehydrogenase family)
MAKGRRTNPDEFAWSYLLYTDISDGGSAARRQAVRSGKIDIVINNATITPLGAVKDRQSKIGTQLQSTCAGRCCW